MRRAMARQIGEEVELPLHMNSASREGLGETVNLYVGCGDGLYVRTESI